MNLSHMGFSTPRVLAFITVGAIATLSAYSGVFGTFSTTLLTGKTCTPYGYDIGYGYDYMNGYGYDCVTTPVTPPSTGGGGGGGGSSAGTSPTGTPSYVTTVDSKGTSTTTSTSGDTKPVVVRASDIAESPYKDAIQTLIENKIVNNNKKFLPEKGITRAEFVKILVLAYGFDKKITADKRFDDVDYGTSISIYINFGVAKGWINVKNDNFRPNDTITFGEAQKLLDAVQEIADADTVAEPTATITRGKAAEMIVAWMKALKK